MEPEIIFSGLCSFLNVRDANATMPEPSVILINTTAEPNPADRHIAHLCFDETKVTVDNAAGFVSVPQAPGFEHLVLDGVEIEIDNDPPAQPTVNASYDRIAKKDDYWPGAANIWDRNFVPLRGQQPQKPAVAAFMRFGSGTIAGGLLSPLEWSFTRNGMSPLVDRYAIEGIYSGFPHTGDDVVIHLRDLDTRALLRTLRFSRIDPAAEKLTLFIGCNDRDDIDNAVQRRLPNPADILDTDHFKYLNRVAAAAAGQGPIPANVRSPVFPPAVPGSAGGVSSGPCGPNSSNG